MQHPYEIAFEGSKDDSARFWTIFYLMSLINGGLFGIVVTSNAEAAYKLLVAALGIAICVIWFLIQRRMHYWCDWWDSKLEELEEDFMGKSQLPAALLFRKRKEKTAPHRKGISTRIGGCLMPTIFGVGWVVLAASLTPPLLRQLCRS